MPRQKNNNVGNIWKITVWFLGFPKGFPVLKDSSLHLLTKDITCVMMEGKIEWSGTILSFVMTLSKGMASNSVIALSDTVTILTDTTFGGLNPSEPGISVDSQ